MEIMRDHAPAEVGCASTSWRCTPAIVAMLQHMSKPVGIERGRKRQVRHATGRNGLRERSAAKHIARHGQRFAHNTSARVHTREINAGGQGDGVGALD